MKSQPVVWALDAFAKNLDVHFKTAQAIALHAPQSLIYPVYVLSEEAFAERGYSCFMRPALKSLAHKNMMAILDHDGLWEFRKAGVFQDPTVLIESSADAALCAQALLRYAFELQANFVAIGMHGRSLVARWFAASFSESILHESRIPVLVSGPHQSSDLHPSNLIVLPTDFHPSRREAFEDLLKIAKERELSIHLLQRPAETLDAWIQSLAHPWGGGWTGFDDAIDDDQSALTQEAVTWLQRAHQLGVTVHVITENFRESAAEAIIDYAKSLEGPDKRSSPTIALLQDHPQGAEALGAETTSSWLNSDVLRDLIRVSPYPLYVAGHA